MYQLVILGARDEREATLVQHIEAGFRSLGLDPSALLRESDTLRETDLRHPVVGVWFGVEEPELSTHQNELVRLCDAGCTIFPVVDKPENFARLTPNRLHEINGYSWEKGPERLAADVLRAFGLTRDQRRAFVSYKRTDSEAVAIQVFHALSDRGYRAFLDTAGVDFGVQFQEVLWDRMADSDLVVFIDTPNALTSRWVSEELTQAHNHSLGVLQLVWPSWKPFEGTDLNFRLLLAERDFDGTEPYVLSGAQMVPNKEGRIGRDTLDLITQAAETVRVRSLGSRQARLHGEIVRAATKNGLESVIQPGGGVHLARAAAGNRTPTGRAMPFIGLPTAEGIFDCINFLERGGNDVRVVYDALGATSRRRAFLTWLDGELASYRCVPLDSLEKWLGGL